jgi:hypothetical protein
MRRNFPNSPWPGFDPAIHLGARLKAGHEEYLGMYKLSRQR